MNFIKQLNHHAILKELTLVSSFLLFLSSFLSVQISAKTTNTAYIGLSSYLTNNHFSEKNSQTNLNTEQGDFIGLGLNGGYALNNKWSVAGQLKQLKSALNYQGVSQNGVPINSHTDYQDQILELTAYYTINPYFVSIGYSHNKQQRDIQGVGEITGLNERYQFIFLAFGLGWQHALSDNLQLQLATNYAYAMRANIKVDFLQRYDTDKNKLNQVTRHQIGAQLAYTLAQSHSVIIGWQYQQIQINKSDTFTLTAQGEHKGFFYQPERKLKQNTLFLSYQIDW